MVPSYLFLSSAALPSLISQVYTVDKEASLDPLVHWQVLFLAQPSPRGMAKRHQCRQADGLTVVSYVSNEMHLRPTARAKLMPHSGLLLAVSVGKRTCSNRNWKPQDQVYLWKCKLQLLRTNLCFHAKHDLLEAEQAVHGGEGSLLIRRG
jgi:hypothetical protein